MKGVWGGSGGCILNCGMYRNWECTVEGNVHTELCQDFSCVLDLIKHYILGM